MRRRTFIAAGAALLAGCAEVAGPPDFSFGGAGFQPDNGRLNLEYAERNLGDMSRYRGKPAETAAALAQFEAAVAAIRNPALGVSMTQMEAEMLVTGLRKERAAIGVSIDTLPQDAAAALAAAVEPLVRRDQAAIRQALSNPVFTLGPDETLARLTNLPPMPEIDSVAPLLTRSAGTIYGGGGGIRLRR